MSIRRCDGRFSPVRIRLAARNRCASTGCPDGLPLADEGDRRFPGFSRFVDARRYVVKIALLPPTFFESTGQDDPGRHQPQVPLCAAAARPKRGRLTGSVAHEPSTPARLVLLRLPSQTSIPWLDGTRIRMRLAD
jgi:hypothetical protein